MIQPKTHTHAKPTTLWGWITSIFHLNGHHHDDNSSWVSDKAFNANEIGIRTVWLALFLLGATTVLQLVIINFSQSVALLADTVHNLGDTLNSIPLLIAFYLARRVATRRYTYGFGRAEDIAGVGIVISMVFSALVVMWESVQKLFNPQPMQNIEWVALAAIVGFLGNEAVALLQIRTGRKIGSEAMIADGLHARVDGLTSLAVLLAVGGTLIGMPILDPIIGLLIGVAIVAITRDATVRIWYRLMDAVDPSLINQIEHYTGEVTGVKQVLGLRARWVGHVLFAEMTVVVDESLLLVETTRIIQDVKAILRRAIPHLSDIMVHVEPAFQHEADTSAEKMARIIPPRYQINVANPAPMGAASLKFDTTGQVAWNDIWTDFCDLALAGGPSHRGTLLEPSNPEAILANPADYEKVLQELERGIHMVTGLPVIRSTSLGWIGMVCKSEEMARWLLRAIIVENVAVRREENTLFFPVGADFRLEKEIKSVITVIAKTTHYWQEHAQSGLQTMP
jgi:cation diffusion facilitator family transporter